MITGDDSALHGSVTGVSSSSTTIDTDVNVDSQAVFLGDQISFGGNLTLDSGKVLLGTAFDSSGGQTISNKSGASITISGTGDITHGATLTTFPSAIAQPEGGGSAFSGKDTSQTGYIFYPFVNVGTGTFTTYGTHTIDIIVVGGGGGGGAWGAGGGGGGSIYERTNYSISAGTYNITVGDGGASHATGSPGGVGTNGSNSKFVVSSGGNAENFIGFGGGGGGNATNGGANGGCGGGQDADVGTAGQNAGLGIDNISAGTTVNGDALTTDHKTNSHATTPLIVATSYSRNGGGGGGAGQKNGKWVDGTTTFTEYTGSNDEAEMGVWGGLGKQITWAQHGYGTNLAGEASGSTRGYFASGGSGLNISTSVTMGGGFQGRGVAPLVNTGAGASGDSGSSVPGASGIVLIRLHL